MDFAEPGKLQQSAKKNETHRCREVGPIAGQQDGGHNDEQRIKEIEECIDIARDMDDGGNESQISEDLGDGLELVFVPEREQQGKEYRDGEPDHHQGDEIAYRNIAGREIDNQ